MKLQLQKSASIQPRTDLPKLGLPTKPRRLLGQKNQLRGHLRAVVLRERAAHAQAEVVHAGDPREAAEDPVGVGVPALRAGVDELRHRRQELHLQDVRYIIYICDLRNL